MLGQKPRQGGVGLVEIMIGVAIVAFLFIAGAPSFSAFMQNTQIRNAAESIQNGLTLARMEAVRRNTSIEFVPGTASSWIVRCKIAVADNDGDGMPDCPGAVPTATTPPYIQSRNADEGSASAVVDASSTLTTANFSGLGKLTTLAAGASAFVYITGSGGLSQCAAGSLRCLKVVVTSNGQIRMCNPILPSSDPQGCT